MKSVINRIKGKKKLKNKKEEGKIFNMAIIMFISFSALNLFLIFNFMNIFNNIVTI